MLGTNTVMSNSPEVKRVRDSRARSGIYRGHDLLRGPNGRWRELFWDILGKMLNSGYAELCVAEA